MDQITIYFGEFSTKLFKNGLILIKLFFFQHYDHHELCEHHLQLAVLHRANHNIIKNSGTNYLAIFGQGHQKKSFRIYDELKYCFW